MSAESGWLATAVGTAVGILGWVVGLGNVVWPEHPQWALFCVVLIVTIGATAIFEHNARRTDAANPDRAFRKQNPS
jgi:hypothetical protein